MQDGIKKGQQFTLVERRHAQTGTQTHAGWYSVW